MFKLTLLTSGFAITTVSVDAAEVTQHGARYREDPEPILMTTVLVENSGSIENQAYALMANEGLKYSIDKFDGTDWIIYKHQVEAVLKKSKCYPYLMTEHSVLKNQSGFTFDEDLAVQAYTDVYMSLSKNVQPIFWNAVDVFELWEKLKERYETQSVASKMQLTRELMNIKQEEGQTIESLFNQLTIKWDSLQSAGKLTTEDDKICKLLGSLNDNYSQIVSVIENTMTDDSKTTAHSIFIKLLGEEQRFIQQGKIKAHNAALNVKSVKKGPKHHQKTGKKSKDHITCYNCDKKGHYASDCRSKKKESSENDNQIAGVAFMANNKLDETSSWILDSGASHHMVTTDILENKVESATSVVCANGKTLHSKYKGTVNAYLNGTKVKINEVLYFPDLSYNLLSISNLSKAGIAVSFKEGECIGELLGKQLFKAEKSGNLFSLNLSRQPTETNALVTHKCETLMDWHKRYGHRDVRTVKKLLDESGIKYSGPYEQCESCLKGKQKRSPIPKTSGKKEVPLEMVSTDVWGKSRTTSLGGSNYYTTFTDHCSRAVHVYFMKSKDETVTALKEYLADIGTTKHRVAQILSDRGGEYTGNNFRTACLNAGIKQVFTAAYTPEQNGISERMNLTLMDAARTILNESGLPDYLWPEAVSHAAYIYNNTPCNSNDGKIPMQVLYGVSCHPNDMHEFGSRVFVHVEKANDSDKLHPRGEEGIFVGFSKNSKCKRIYFPQSRKVAESRDVRFIHESSSVITIESNTKNVDHITDALKLLEIKSKDDVNTDDKIKRNISKSKNLNLDSNDYEGVMTRSRFQAQRKQEMEQNNNDKGSVGLVMLAIEPVSFKEAAECKDAAKWQEAMENEIDSLKQNDTFELVNLPPGRKTISSKWVYKLKLNKDGEINRYKARLVARGFTQIHGIDYEETFSPVVKIQTVLTVFGLVNAQQLLLHQMDVDTAFLYGDLDEEIYLKAPDGIETRGKVLKLKKSLYGLKQASRNWNNTIDKHLLANGFMRSQVDNCLYIRHSDNGIELILLYVDDLLVVAKDMSGINRIKQVMIDRFKMKDIGKISVFLGMEVNIKRESHQLTVTQFQYTKRILSAFDMTECKSVSTPMESRLKLPDGSDVKDDEIIDKPYRKLIGSLLYLSTHTRPDIAEAVGSLSRNLERPTREHWEAGMYLLRYLRGTIEHGIVFEGDEANLIGYSDASWASTFDMRSVSGYVFKMNNAAISWRSRKQSVVALSSTEAEYVALAEAVKEAIWLKKLFIELQLMNQGSSTLVYEDNMSCIKVSKNDSSHGRMKHVDIKYHFIRDQVEKKEINIQYCKTTDMIADLLTKSLGKHQFILFRDLMGVKELRFRESVGKNRSSVDAIGGT